MTLNTGNIGETPSGKKASGENFPVGSFLLPAGLRPHVAAFYAYARAIDDIADNPELSAEDKKHRLGQFESALLGKNSSSAYQKALKIRSSLLKTGVPTRHCQDLISAFKQDAVKTRYRDWPELIDYCDRSAAPVGRYLLDLHGENPSSYPASDALCNALQVLNHLQDCQDDYRNLDRVYLPSEWMEGADITVASLDAPQSDAGLRQVIDKALDHTDLLIEQAEKLPSLVKNWHLAMESAVIIDIAKRLAKKLRKYDPLAIRVELTRVQYFCCFMSGIWFSLWRKRVH